MTLLMLLLLAADIPPTGGRPRPGATMVKPVVCKAIEAARGKAGAELAEALEAAVSELAAQNYQLTALVAGDPPVACFRSLARPEKLPRGAR